MTKQAKIVDQNGRVGVITEIRDTGVFAKPEGIDYTIDGEAPGVGAAKFITATFWTRSSDVDGRVVYRGTWYDDGIGADILTATYRY